MSTDGRPDKAARPATSPADRLAAADQLATATQIVMRNLATTSTGYVRQLPATIGVSPTLALAALHYLVRGGFIEARVDPRGAHEYRALDGYRFTN